MTKYIRHCIRCSAESFEGIMLTKKQSDFLGSNRIIMAHLEVGYENIVCDFCRKGIGQGLADNILHIFNSTRKNEAKPVK